MRQDWFYWLCVVGVIFLRACLVIKVIEVVGPPTIVDGEHSLMGVVKGAIVTKWYSDTWDSANAFDTHHTFSTKESCTMEEKSQGQGQGQGSPSY